MTVLYLNQLSVMCFVWNMFGILISDHIAHLRAQSIQVMLIQVFYALLFQRFPAGLQW